MTDIRRMLSDQERAEYDDLLYTARFHDDGTSRPTGEIGERMHALLEDATQAQKPWAQWVMDDDARAGHVNRSKRWDRVRRVVSTRAGDVIVKRSAIQAIKRLDKETGAMFWEDAHWADMNADDLSQIINGGEQRIQSAKEVTGIARSLLGLIDSTGQGTVADALESIGVSIDDYLTRPGESAA